MAVNRIIAASTMSDIDRRVDRLLRGLGNPSPPLRLEHVRELLHLDKAFYTADDPGIVDLVVSRLRVAGVQVLKRPTLLADAIRKLSLKALYLPDRQRILLDSSLPPIKHRWNEAHEIGHSIIPWHQAVMGDDLNTLAPDCRAEVEAEANFAAARLLFLHDQFTDQARSGHPSIDLIGTLKDVFGNTLSTTLYHFVETAGAEVPLLGLISPHPNPRRRSASFDPSRPFRHFIRSPAFATRFSSTSQTAIFNCLAGYCGSQRGGPLGQSELLLSDDNGDPHRFHFETFFNSYDALTLGVYLRPHSPLLPVRA